MTRIPPASRSKVTLPPAVRGLDAERLAALHRMSGAIVHDLNNLFGVILGANERLAAELGEGGDQQKHALIGLEAAERGAALLRRLLSLAQDEARELDPIDCADVLQTLRRLARQAIAPGVRVSVWTPAAPLHCAGDRVGLEMALLNLCLNAGQATSDGGSVSVRARATRLTAGEARGLGLAPGGYVAFSVQDTGKGMSAETLARATDPLFTTRPAGTGLGLSSVLDFATAAEGALLLQAREGEGATATLFVPLAQAETAAQAA
ncbi:ATP-binding protein [Phenylobacterium sp.]|jgi:signal transduction histidine kinase|uniref:ATP-binding protein n=1 Tax=Phenylobacterium sp. TaxID=1871053 RepID=UPI002E310346|nr:ATP-binding protein [Phenylobacterium sp.]HEX4711490.1 ATP-binding protein [Phenylobacterium sp.]